MTTIAIVNPAGGEHRAGEVWPNLVQQLADRAGEVETWWTKKKGDGESLAARARRLGAARVLAVGGDGTIFEVINGLWWEPQGKLPSLGIVPFCTGCDYIRNLEIGANLQDNLVQALGENTVAVDVAVLQLRNQQGESLSRIFLNTMAIGFNAWVIARYHRQNITRFHNKIRYFISTLHELSRLKHHRWHGQIDGKDLQGNSLIFLAGMAPFSGGGMLSTPLARPQDGHLHLVWDQGLGRLELLALLPAIYWGKHLHYHKIEDCLAHGLKLHADPPSPVEADGELVGLTPVEITVARQALQVAAAGLKKS